MTLLKKIYFLLSPEHRKDALILSILMLIGMVFETLSIGLVIPAIAIIMQQNFWSRYPVMNQILFFTDNPSQTQMIITSMTILTAVYFFKNIFLGFLTWRQTRFAFSIQVQLSLHLFKTYLRQPYTFHLERNSAQLIRNISSEVLMFTAAIASGLIVITEILVVIGISLLLVSFEPLGAIIVVTVLGIFTFGFYRITKNRITNWGQIRQDHEGLRIQHLQQGLAGAKDVKLLGREADFMNQFSKHNIESARVGSLQLTLQQIPRLWLELLAVLGLYLLVISMLNQENQNIDHIIPTLALFAAAAFRLMPSVNRTLASIQSLRYNLPVIDLLYEESKLQNTDSTPVNTEIITFNKEIKLIDISYKYSTSSKFALKKINLSIKIGESVGFIGSSGSGKSTLIDVILGLLAPVEGKIMLDGIDIQTNLRSWQDQIGYVPQSIFLTDDTLRRNVAFGLADNLIDDEAVSRAVKAAQLEAFVSSLPERLETIIGERGVRLSGGQRQRIGIARALYHDPSILVLDEATSALDTTTEAGVMAAVTALHGKKTVVIVAHRLSTLENCDRIYKLDHGILIDQEPI
jgi:ABC-type multidrug transport system fused ATPase/permease subunit